MHTALPFGVSLALGEFTMMAPVTMAGLRQQQEALAGMIDDSLGGVEQLQERWAAKEMGTRSIPLQARRIWPFGRSQPH